MPRLPSIFLSHGAPTMAGEMKPEQTIKFLKRLSKWIKTSLPEIKAILCISAHWETRDVHRVTTSTEPDQIYDFYGFPKKFYELKYPARGHPEQALKVVETLKRQGVKAEGELVRGLDHGTWVPMAIMFPEANIPVLQLSLDSKLLFEDHLKVGQALKQLRNEGILVLGSGGAVHNLREVELGKDDAEAAAWAKEFQSMLVDALCNGKGGPGETCDKRLLKLVHENGQLLSRAHPRLEHLMPLFVTVGALFEDELNLHLINSEIIAGSLSLAAFSTEKLE